MDDKLPADHPLIDWTKWEPAGEGDGMQAPIYSKVLLKLGAHSYIIVRSPCPMINALANHHVLPHDGKLITKTMAVDALTNSINLSSGIANVFASVAVKANPDPKAQSFDLNHVDKHGLIEHDVSLSRNDVALGDNHTFDIEIWKTLLESYGDATETSFELVSKARYERLVACKKAHEVAKKDLQYGIKEFVLSYGESALLLGLLGSPKDGIIPLEYLRVLFGKTSSPEIDLLIFEYKG